MQALLESGSEKDKLFRQVHDRSPDIPETLTASKLAELQGAKEEIARLHNEIVNKDGEGYLGIFYVLNKNCAYG